MSYNEENLPKWWKDLVGESPLLSSPEWMFIVDIRSQIMIEIKSKPKISTDEGVNMKEKLSVMKDNFQQVVKHLKMNRAHWQYFMDVYPKWRNLRDRSIECLKKIENSIQEVRQKCQMANIIGSCVSLIGGGLSLASGCRLAPIKSSTMIGLGFLTSLGSSVVEASYLHDNIKEAEKILKEDEECSEHLWEWLSDSSHLKIARDNIRFADVDSDLRLAACVFEAAYEMNRGKTRVEKLTKRMLSSLDVSPEFAEDISDAIGILIATEMLDDRHRPLFDFAHVCTKFTEQLSSVINMFRASLVVRTCRRAVVTAAQKTRVAAGMVLDLINILLVCKDFTSVNMEVKMVIEASDVLQKEIEIFEKLYYEVENFHNDNFSQSPEQTLRDFNIAISENNVHFFYGS